MVVEKTKTNNRNRPHTPSEKMKGHLELKSSRPNCLSKAEIDVILLRRKIIK